MIISLIGLKGGIGKTTLSVCIAAELHQRKKKVLLVDADPQGSTQKWREKAVKEEDWPSVIAYSRPILHKKDQVRSLAKNYDFTIVDTPPFEGEMSRSAMIISDIVLLPVTPSGLDLEELKKTISLVEEAKVVNDDLQAYIVVSNRPPTSVFGRKMKSILTDDAFQGTPMLEAEICSRISFREMTMFGDLIHSYEPNSKAHDEVKKLVDEVLRINE